MQNFFGSKLNSVLLLILIILMIVAIKIMLKTPEVYFSSSGDTTQSVEILGNKADLVSFSISPGAKVSGVVSYTGAIKGGYFFEANMLVNILDKNKNILKQGNTTATTDWMTAGAVSFSGALDLSGLPKGEAYIELHNDNASGLPENDKSILVPIVIE